MWRLNWIDQLDVLVVGVPLVPSNTTLQNTGVHQGPDWSVRANIVYRRSYSRPE